MTAPDPKDSRPGARPAPGGSLKVDPPPADPAEGKQAASPPPADIHAYIGSRLREVYDDVARQPIPDRFLELMRQLDTK